MPPSVVTCYSSLSENCEGASVEATTRFRGSGADTIPKMIYPDMDSRLEKSGDTVRNADLEFVLYGKASAPAAVSSSAEQGAAIDA